MPLVQSLDLLRRRVQSPVFQGVLHDVHERVRSGTALSDAFAVHGALIPSVYTASLLAGERSGSLDTRAAALRRVFEDHRDGQAQDDVGAHLSDHPDHARVHPGRDHRFQRRAGLHRFLRQLRGRSAADHPDHRAHLERAAPAADVRRHRRDRRRSRRSCSGCGSPARWRASITSSCACRWSARSRASSRRRRWRARWPRCSAAVCRSSTRSTSRPDRSAISTSPASSRW